MKIIKIIKQNYASQALAVFRFQFSDFSFQEVALAAAP